MKIVKIFLFRFCLNWILVLALVSWMGQVLVFSEPQSGGGASIPFLEKGSEVFTVMDMQEGYVILSSPSREVRINSYLVFVRPKSTDFEIIARGKIVAVQNGKVLADLAKDSIIKIPYKGDLGISMSPPKDWPNESEEVSVVSPLMSESEIPDEPGYIQLDWGQMKGELKTEASDQMTNSYKLIPQFSPQYFHFCWYVEFLWRFGLEYEKYSANMSTSTYYRDFGMSSGLYGLMGINWRSRRFSFLKKLRLTLRALALSTEFNTLNTDELLISSTLSAVGLGLRLGYEFKEPTWHSGSKTRITLQQISGDLDYFPSLSLQDLNGINRGQIGSGSNVLQWSLRGTVLAYIPRSPLIARYLLDFSYMERQTNLKFSGSTSSESTGIYKIPQNLTAQEKEVLYWISIGFRLDDFVGKFFKPRG